MSKGHKKGERLIKKNVRLLRLITTGPQQQKNVYVAGVEEIDKTVH